MEFDKEGDIKQNKWKYFMSRGKRHKRAIESYYKAIIEYNKNKQYTESYRVYLKIIDLYNKNKNYDFDKDITEVYEEVIKLTNLSDDLKQYKFRLMNACADIYVNIGRHTSAIRLLEKIGNYEYTNLKYSDALIVYSRIQTLCKMEDMYISFIKYSSVIADIYIETKDYKSSVLILDEMIKVCIENKCNKYMIYDYIFSILLCKILLTITEDESIPLFPIIDRYIIIYPDFEKSSEYSLLKNCISAYVQDDIIKFDDIIGKCHIIYPIKNSHMMILGKIKETMASSSNKLILSDDGPDLR
jgi:tetratricopeptide (TPR) repeat protein